MLRHCLVSAATVARRAIPVLGLAAALALAALGPPAPTGAAAPSPEPVARLQVVVKQVTIHDDHDGRLRGVGEMMFYPYIWRCNEGVPVPCNAEDNSERGFIVIAEDLFQASTGETVTLNRPLPRNGDEMHGGNTSEKLGFAVYSGARYVLRFKMQEDDGFVPPRYEQLGEVSHFIDTAEHGLGLGTHTARSFKHEQYQWGDFTITYEIRRTPLPDLRPVNIKVHDMPGSAKKRVCTAVQNVEAGHAGAFEVALRVDGAVPPDGRAAAIAPTPGNHIEVCVETTLPDSGELVLAAVVDEQGALLEFNEANNVHEQVYTATSAPAPARTPTPSAALPDRW